MATIDRNYWMSNTSSENISTVDAILTVINGCCKHDYELKYNKAFIGLGEGETPCHFLVVYPQKSQCAVAINIEQDDRFNEILDGNYPGWNYKNGWYNFKVDSRTVSSFASVKEILVQAEIELRKELEIKGSKKIETIQKEFNRVFPYIRLCLFDAESKEKMARGESVYQLGKDLLLAEVRTKKGTGEVSINGIKKLKTLSAEFEAIYGLNAVICYVSSDGQRYYTSGDDQEMSLAKFNDKCKNDGCKKGVYR